MLIFSLLPLVATGQTICLSESFPKTWIAEHLVPQNAWHPFPRAAERPSWEALDACVIAHLLADAEAALELPIPALPATGYLQFQRDGNRGKFQSLYTERRDRLRSLVLGECVEGKGRFLDPIANTLWAICEESTWVLPAHIQAQQAGSGLPDTSEPTVDLAVGQTANSLAWTAYLLREELNAVSPEICLRIDREINHRFLTPFLERSDFSWMGFLPNSSRPNNWNPWINANLLCTALLTESDPERRVQLAHKALRSLDNFLGPYPSDGSCDEGPGYWGHAAGSLFEGLHWLHEATEGAFDPFQERVIREMGRYLVRSHIAADYFVPLGDCHPTTTINRALVYRYGKKVEDREMQALATAYWDQETMAKMLDTSNLGRLLPTLFTYPEIAHQPTAAPLLRDVWLGNPDLEMMAARDQQGTAQGLYVATWCGHNAQSHNHNDVGNFIIYLDGQPFIIDVGVPSYSRQTFSARRYEIWAMRSVYHNLPIVNGTEQQQGSRYRAQEVGYAVDAQSAQLQSNIAPSYPQEAGLERWDRTVRLLRQQAVVVTDLARFRQAGNEVTQVLMTPCTVLESGPDALILKHPRSQRSLVIQLGGQGWSTSQIETLELKDRKLKEAWGPSITRILLTQKIESDRWESTLEFHPGP